MKRLTYFLTLTLLSFFMAVCVGCKGKDVSKTVANNSVLVQLHNDSSSVQLENQFAGYALKEGKKVSRPMHIYLFSFDSEKVRDTTLVRLLKESSLVKEAQTNKDITSREQ